MIGIIAAMQEEAAYLKSKMSQINTIQVAGQTFHTGKINDTAVVLLECGIGKVNAAIGTTLLIERFKPAYVINTGTAGGLHENLQVGDVVISLEVRHHDVDLTVWGYDHGQLPKLPAAFTADLMLVEAAEHAAEQLKMRVTKGLIISGDAFIADAAHTALLREKFPQVQAVEMEAAAIAQVCHQFQVPFVIIRALSDIADKDSTITFDIFLEQAAQKSAELILATLKEIAKEQHCI